MRSVGLIWAQTLSGVIGADGGIPWHIREDMERFRQITNGRVVIMGRKTWDSLPDRFRPLPGRRNIVITRDPDWAADGAEAAESVARALTISEPDEAWIIGGAEIYREAMRYATEIAVTMVEPEVPGDTYAPEIDPVQFILAYTDGPHYTADHSHKFQFRGYARK